MTPNLTNLTLVTLTLLGAAASWLAWRRLRITMKLVSESAPSGQAGTDSASASAPAHPSKLALNTLVAVIALGAALLLVGRWKTEGTAGQPLTAHVDGLLLIAALLAAVGLFIQSRPRLGGLAAFYLPLLTLILAWAICASAWTYRPFKLDDLSPVWKAVHLVGVYLGTLGCAVAAVSGGMYLYVEGQLKTKANPRGLMRLASLETLERLIHHAATLGFALLTLGLVSGVVILREAGTLGDGWWATPKVLLAFASWALYAVVMNVRFATAFRGRRAAWLAIGGFVLLLVVYGIVTRGDQPTEQSRASESPTAAAGVNPAAGGCDDTTRRVDTRGYDIACCTSEFGGIA